MSLRTKNAHVVTYYTPLRGEPSSPSTSDSEGSVSSSRSTSPTTVVSREPSANPNSKDSVSRPTSPPTVVSQQPAIDERLLETQVLHSENYGCCKPGCRAQTCRIATPMACFSVPFAICVTALSGVSIPFGVALAGAPFGVCGALTANSRFHARICEKGVTG